jgi:hypothetical protein
VNSSGNLLFEASSAPFSPEKGIPQNQKICYNLINGGQGAGASCVGDRLAHQETTKKEERRPNE